MSPRHEGILGEVALGKGGGPSTEQGLLEGVFEMNDRKKMVAVPHFGGTATIFFRVGCV